MQFVSMNHPLFHAAVRFLGHLLSRASVTKTLALTCVVHLAFSPPSWAQPGKHPSITWKAFNATGPELKEIGRMAVRHSKGVESSPWSVGCETLDRDYAKFSTYKDFVGELGVKHARLQSGWAKCEKEKGVYEFAWLDECVYGLKEQGVEPWICLCYGNPIYGSDIRLGAGIAELVHSKEALAAWMKYVEAAVSRYKDVVREWEIWNEPNGHGCEEYAILLMKTSEAIRKANPNAVILGMSLAGTGTRFPQDVFEILKTNGKLDAFDYLTYHPYTGNPDSCYPAVEKLQQLVESYNPKIQLYQGECGCPSILEWGHALARYPWTEYSQAKWFLRRMAGDRVRGIRSSVFTIIDLRYWNMLQSFGLIRSNLVYDIIYKRPSYYGVQHMAGFFDDKVKPAGLLACESNSPREITVAGFEKNGKPVLLVWYGDQVPSDELKWDAVDLVIKKTTFQDPVYVEMITGRVYELDKSAWTNEGEDVKLMKLPIWDSPTMIADREQVALREEK